LQRGSMKSSSTKGLLLLMFLFLLPYMFMLFSKVVGSWNQKKKKTLKMRKKKQSNWS
jgi:hypothetical protein